MGMKKVIFVGCIFLVGNSYAQSSMNCGEKLSEKSINYKELFTKGTFDYDNLEAEQEEML